MITRPRGETMDIFLIKKTVNNEDGMVMIFAVMVLMILTISGVAAINISNNETTIVRNEQLSSSEFYQAESGINDARINFVDWLTNAFLMAGDTVANATLSSISSDANGNPVANIQVRCIENNAPGGKVTPIFTDVNDPGYVLGDYDVPDQMPAMPHKGNPPVGSGYSIKNFEVRRYSITSTSNAGNIVVQAGVWKTFNKY